MKKLHSLTLCALIAPAMTLGAGSALAQQDRTTQQSEQMQRQAPEGTQPRTTPDRQQTPGTTQPGTMQRQEPGTQPRTQPGTPPRGQQSPDVGRGDMQRDPRATGGVQQRGMREDYLVRKPASGFHADDLIGSSIRSRADNSNIGSVSDLVIDENGQVVAVVVGVGGFLGMGQKDVAIGWDAIQRTPKRTGTGFDYHIDASEDALRNAPTYSTD